MGRRGPKPKHAAEAELTGNAGRRTPRADVLAKPLEAPPGPPANLSEHARALWASFASDLVARSLLALCDLPALGMLCQAYADYYEAVDDIARNGASGTTDKGYEFPRPAVGRQATATAQILTLSARFGLTPADRVGMGDRTTKQPTGAPLADQTGGNDDPPPPGTDPTFEADNQASPKSKRPAKRTTHPRPTKTRRKKK